MLKPHVIRNDVYLNIYMIFILPSMDFNNKPIYHRKQQLCSMIRNTPSRLRYIFQIITHLPNSISIFIITKCSYNEIPNSINIVFMSKCS